MGTLKGFEWLVLILIIVVPAMVPITIALIRRTTNRTTVILVALLTSWTLIGWVIAIVLASIGKPEPLKTN